MVRRVAANVAKMFLRRIRFARCVEHDLVRMHHCMGTVLGCAPYDVIDTQMRIFGTA